MQVSPDELPEWIKYLVATVLGAGGVHWFKVWLEDRRLGKKEFRELLMGRIQELEAVVSQMQKRMGNLRVEMAHLEVENRQMRRQLGLPVVPHVHVDPEKPPGDSSVEPSQS